MTELAYDDRATNFHTTNTTIFDTSASSLVGGLSVTVVGTGAPVEVEFFVPSVQHNSGATTVTVYLVVNGTVTGTLSQYRNFASGVAEGGSLRRRLVLANGVSYTFQVGAAGQAAGGITSLNGQYTWGSSSAGVMYLRVTD